MIKPIPYGRQNINKSDIDEVVKVLKSDFLTQGPKVSEFEKKFAKYVNSKYAVAVSNGTAALHLCAISLNVKPGSKVITSPISFVASANCVRYCGGDVVFADIDPKTYLIDLKSVEKLLESSSPGTFSGIIPVNFAGRCVDLELLDKIKSKYDLWILEDACHSPGGYFVDSSKKKHFSGGSIYSDLSIFSFHPVKHIATGEGGMITTNNYNLYKKISKLRSHGINRGNEKFLNSNLLAGSSSSDKKSYPTWYMEMDELGYNYRLSDINAALGISQLKRANDSLNKRIKIAKKYNNAFAKIKSITNYNTNLVGHAFHLFVIEVKERYDLYNYLRKSNIFCQIHYFPIHLMPYYKKKYNYRSLKFSEKFYNKCISLPIYPSLTSKEQNYIIKKIIKFFK